MSVNGQGRRLETCRTKWECCSTRQSKAAVDLSLSLSTPPERMTALKEWTAAKKQLSTANAGLQQNVPGWWEVGGEVGGVIVAWWRSEEFVDENASVSALEKKVH